VPGKGIEGAQSLGRGCPHANPPEKTVWGEQNLPMAGKNYHFWRVRFTD
jgi:hypothetical protein